MLLNRVPQKYVEKVQSVAREYIEIQQKTVVAKALILYGIVPRNLYVDTVVF